jgi:hypothetical protein
MVLQNVPPGQSRLVVQLDEDWQDCAALQKSPGGQPLSLRHLQEPDVASHSVLAGQPLGVHTQRLAVVSWTNPAGQQASPEQMQARTAGL